MSARDEEQHFLDKFCGWLAQLPHDLKVLFEAKDDPNLDRPAREIAAGAIVHVLNPDTSGEEAFVSYGDDVLLFRQVLSAIRERGGEDADAFTSRFADYYDSLDDDLKLCRKVMGDEVYEWTNGKIGGLPKLVYKSKKVAQYLDSEEQSEILYEDGLEFGTEYPVDEEQLHMRVKKCETLIEPLRRKARAEKQKIS